MWAAVNEAALHTLVPVSEQLRGHSPSREEQTMSSSGSESRGCQLPLLLLPAEEGKTHSGRIVSSGLPNQSDVGLVMTG